MLRRQLIGIHAMKAGSARRMGPLSHGQDKIACPLTPLVPEYSKLVRACPSTPLPATSAIVGRCQPPDQIAASPSIQRLYGRASLAHPVHTSDSMDARVRLTPSIQRLYGRASSAHPVQIETHEFDSPDLD